MGIMTLNQITVQLASVLGRELDEPLRLMLADRVKAWRSTLLLRSLEKHPEQFPQFRQRVKVRMELWNDPCAIPGSSARYRSINPVPEPMRLEGARSYTGSVDGQNPFRFSEPGTLFYLALGKYSKDTVFYTYDDGHIILDRNIPVILLSWVFDDPTAASACCEDCCGKEWDEPFPATGDIIQAILQYIPEVDFGRKRTEATPEIPVNKEETGG